MKSRSLGRGSRKEKKRRRTRERKEGHPPVCQCISPHWAEDIPGLRNRGWRREDAVVRINGHCNYITNDLRSQQREGCHFRRASNGCSRCCNLFQTQIPFHSCRRLCFLLSVLLYTHDLLRSAFAVSTCLFNSAMSSSFDLDLCRSPRGKRGRGFRLLLVVEVGLDNGSLGRG